MLHRAHKVGIIRLRQHPMLLQPRLDLVLFNVCRTHSRLIDSTTCNSTSLSLNNRKVHRACPAGGGEHATATRCASAVPSSLRRGCSRRGLRSIAADSPSSTYAFRTRFTARVDTWSDWATCSFVDPEPSTPASALSST